MHLTLDELLKKSKRMQRLLVKIKDHLPDEAEFDRLLVLVCMGKGGFLPLTALPNHHIMSLICESSDLLQQIMPYVDQQFLYQCMDEGTKSEIVQSINIIRQNNLSKGLREEHYFRALTIFYQVIYETAACKGELWEEFIYRLVAHWNSVNKDFIHAVHERDTVNN